MTWLLVFWVCGIATCDARFQPVTEQQCKAIVANSTLLRNYALFCVAPDGARWPSQEGWKQP